MKKVILILAICMIAGVVNGGVIDHPKYLVGVESPQVLEMADSDRLMINGVAAARDGGEYHILLGKITPSGLVFGGFLTTDNDKSNNDLTYDGWMSGSVDLSVFLPQESPVYALAIRVPDGGRFAVFENDTITFDDDIVLGWESGFNFMPGSGPIERDGVVDGFLNITFSPGNSEVGSVSLVPEPVTFGLLGVGGLLLRRRRR